jgi:hypothetical protein
MIAAGECTVDDRKVLESYPLPLARGYRRYRNAAEARERHDAAYYCFEIYLKYAASIAIAHYLTGGQRDHRVNAALKGLARPSLGEWLRFLRECLGFLAGGSSPDPVVASLAKLFEEKESRPEALRELYNGLRAFRAGSPSERDKLDLSMLFEEVVAYRNRVLGHGAPPGKEHFQVFGGLFGKSFPDLLEESPYLTARRLVAFDSLQVEGGRQEGGARIECGVVEYMSDRPIRRESPHVIPYGREAPEKPALHLLAEDGGLLSLEPLLIAHDEDVYLLNEAEGTPEYLSYSTGARHRPAGAGEAQRRLFERILGYAVDSSQLSRISEDLAPAPESTVKAPAGGEARKLGDYRIVREVGRGAMGAVFEAVQESLGRRVALKVLPGSARHRENPPPEHRSGLAPTAETAARAARAPAETAAAARAGRSSSKPAGSSPCRRAPKSARSAEKAPPGIAPVEVRAVTVGSVSRTWTQSPRSKGWSSRVGGKATPRGPTFLKPPAPGDPSTRVPVDAPRSPAYGVSPRPASS